MEKYPQKSVFNPDYWEKVILSFTLMKKEGVNVSLLAEDEVWKDIPVGMYLEKIRQVRCMNKLTVEEMIVLHKMGVDLQYLKRRWNYMYQRAKEYYIRYGHLSVSSKEDTELSRWVIDQRRRYMGGPRKRQNRIAVYTPLTNEQRRLLEDIEIIWDTSSTWFKYSPLLKKYYEEMHDTNVPSTFFVGPLNLGNWVNQVKRKRIQLTDEQIRFLDKMSFNWDIRSIANTSFPEQATFFYFSFWFTDALSRYKENGIEFDIYSPKCKIAIEYDGFIWHKNKLDRDNKKDEYCKRNKIKLIRIREEGLSKTKYATNYFLTLPFSIDNYDALIKKIYYYEFGNPLVDIDTRIHGFEILKGYRRLEDMAFYRHLEELKEYISVNHSFPPSNRKSHAGLLGWIYSLRRIYIGQVHGVLTNEMIHALDEIGFVWNPSEKKLQDLYIHLKKYVEQGYDYLPANYIDPVDGFTLGRKICNLRQRGPKGQIYRGTALTKEWILRFDNLGMNWTPHSPLLKPRNQRDCPEVNP